MGPPMGVITFKEGFGKGAFLTEIFVATPGNRGAFFKSGGRVLSEKNMSLSRRGGFFSPEFLQNKKLLYGLGLPRDHSISRLHRRSDNKTPAFVVEQLPNTVCSS